MQLSTPRRKSLVNLTPLIDVVFILLIFFMLASNFIRWHYIELSVGDASDAEVDHQKISIITINPDESYTLNEQQLPINAIILKVREKLRHNIEHPIVVKPEQGTDVQTMVNVLNRLKDFAGNNISVAKPENEEK
ncbi:MAG: ExbD/TolR family protein [Gammaproteobacteria bacterium]